MKFRLVEKFGRVTTPLNEKTDIYFELSNYLMADMANNTYTPRGFISHMGRGKQQELFNNLCQYLMKRDNIEDVNQAMNIAQDILDNWVVHHINGVHPESYSDKNNSSQNIVLLETTKLHEEITNKYRKEISECIKRIPTHTTDDIDKLLLRLLVVCRESGEDVNNILKVDMSDFENALYEIPNKLTQYFESNYSHNRKDVIYLSDLNLSW